MRAEIVQRQPLLYTDPPQPGRPPHVRAGSALVWLGNALAIVQDDCLWLAQVVPGHSVIGTPLPEVAGRRIFDHAHKHLKPDLEAAFVLGQRLVALGSGSAPGRDRWLLVDVDVQGRVVHAAWFPAAPLYAQLAANRAFSGSALNVEGAVVAGPTLWLLNRGNGAARDDQPPVNALMALALADVATWLAGNGPVPEPRQVVMLEPGTVEGVALTTTDVAALPDGRLLLLAAAEASANAVEDGAVVGAALGVWSGGHAVWTPILEQGQRFVGKPEGIAVDRVDAQRAWLVLDADDPARPSELCLLHWSV